MSVSDPRPLVSVIVPVYNGSKELAGCLGALTSQTYDADRVEIIVVDNGSTDDLSELRAKYPHVQWLVEPVPGSYNARNRGVSQASGQILAFTDADCAPDDGWLEGGVRALQSSPDTGLVAGRIELVFRDPGRGSIWEVYDALSSISQERAITLARFGATANLFTTRRVMDEVGGFDGGLLSGGDREWGNRVFDAGFRQVYCDGALVRHPARSTFGGVVDRSLRVTVSTRVAGPDARYTGAYVARHVVQRPREMWRQMSDDPRGTGLGTRVAVLALYFALKCLQLGERLRVGIGLGGPRR